MVDASQADQTVVLAQRLRAADPGAASLLDTLYRKPLVRFCWGYLGDGEEAEDAVHDVWCKVLSAKKIPEHFRPWLYRVARNQCLNVLRHRKRRRDGGRLPDVSQIGESLTGHLTRLVKDEQHRRLIEIVQELPPKQREVLRLRYVEDLSRAEIADVLEIAPSSVKTQLFEGLKKLRKHISLFDER